MHRGFWSWYSIVPQGDAHTASFLVFGHFPSHIGLGTRLAAARALLSDQRGNHGRCYEGNQELVNSTSNSINGQSWELVFADTFSSLLLWKNHE
jgi:hypothetical protein